MKILINLIGGQTIPNLIAQKYIQPDKIILLFSKGSIKQRDSFKSVFSNMTFEDKEIEPFNYNNIKAAAMDIIKNNSDDDLILNFTGGTKIMSVASYEVFKKENLLSIYVDSENSRIYKYKNGNASEEDMNIKITSEEYLKLNGHIYKIKDVNNPDESRQSYFEYLEKNFNEDISKFLTKINDKFEENKQAFYKNNNKTENGKNRYIWNDIEKRSCISINGQDFIISGKDSIKYITGLWFEDLVYYKKFQGTKFYDEVIRNIHIQDKFGKQDMIELDVLGLYKNNLHLFEFKSGKPRREAINNLRTIKEQLGTYTKLFLISYFDLPKGDTLRDRMEDLGIKFFKYNDFNLNKCFEQTNINL